MTLRDIELKNSYDSDMDDVLDEFYIPALSESVSYRRLAGSFSSSALAVAARGISRLIKNGGNMKLVVGADLSRDDIDAIIKGSVEKDKVISDIMLEDLESITNEFIKDHVRALAWLVANCRMEIKVAIVIGENGIPLEKELIQQRGIFHPKIGILEDKEGNIVSFGGSVNESENGWLYNDEHFYVFANWKNNEFRDLCNSNITKFELCWNGVTNKLLVMDVPKAYQQQLIKIAPSKIEDLNLERFYKNKRQKQFDKFISTPNKLIPYNFQLRAIQAIKKNSFRGILKMATGTGKTVCAFFILRQFFQEIKFGGNRIVILVPSGRDRIGGQWETFLRKNSGSNDYVFRYDSEISSDERDDLIKMWKSDLDSKTNLYIIITIQSLENFDLFNKYPDIIIADEVHEYGTTLRYNIIKNKFPNILHTIGLSATPERFYDNEGTQRILDLFGPIVFKYHINEAQTEEKYPGSETVLSKYLYNLYVVELTQEEEIQVKEITAKIGMNIAINNDPSISEREVTISEEVQRLLQKRALVVKKAKNKLKILEQILKDNRRYLKQCIVYCEDIEQLNFAKDIFESLNLKSYVVYNYRIENRAKALELFREQNCNFILSINCLDQGIDIPSCESLILLTGSTNPRQYIQRRGRVLRNFKNKHIANIYDIMAFPSELNDGYLGIVKSQILRAWEFIEESESPYEKSKLVDIITKYNLSQEDLTAEIRSWW